MKVTLTRLTDNGIQTLGVLQCYNELMQIFECKTLELPWKNNSRQVSCIPTGNYQVVKHNSPTFGNVFKVLNVPDRSEILIHTGNYNKDTKGCLLVGRDFIDINKDGITDITGSKQTFEKLMALSPSSFELLII